MSVGMHRLFFSNLNWLKEKRRVVTLLGKSPLHNTNVQLLLIRRQRVNDLVIAFYSGLSDQYLITDRTVTNSRIPTSGTNFQVSFN